MNALPGSANSSRSLENVCKPYITHWDTARAYLYRLFNTMSQTSFSVPYFRSSPIFFFPCHNYLAEPVPQPMPIYLWLQSPVSPDQFAPFSPLHIATSRCTNHFLHLFSSFRATFLYFIVKRLSWSCKILLESRMFAMPPYHLTCTRHRRITLASTSFETSCSTRLVWGSILLMGTCHVWAPKEFFLLIIVVVEPHSLPMNRVSCKAFLFFPGTTSVSQTARKIALLMFLHAN